MASSATAQGNGRAPGSSSATVSVAPPCGVRCTTSNSAWRSGSAEARSRVTARPRAAGVATSKGWSSRASGSVPTDRRPSEPGTKSSAAPSARTAASTTPATERTGTSPAASGGGAGATDPSAVIQRPRPSGCSTSAAGQGPHATASPIARSRCHRGRPSAPTDHRCTGSPSRNTMAPCEVVDPNANATGPEASPSAAASAVAEDEGDEEEGPAWSSRWTWVITARATTPSTSGTTGPSRPRDRRVGAPNP